MTEKSDYFDEKILREQNRSNLKYVGGKIKFKLSKNQININTELYFKNTDEIWFVQKYSDSVNKSRFNDWDTNEDLIMLSRYKTIEFDRAIKFWDKH